jgi:hypothetical protein
MEHVQLSNAQMSSIGGEAEILRSTRALLILTLVRHGRLTMGFASLNPSYEFAAGTSAPQ